MPTMPGCEAESQIAESRVVRRVAASATVAIMLGATWHWGLQPQQRAHFGDDQEYLTMTTSFMRHGSPRFRPGDEVRALYTLPRVFQKTLARKIKPGAPPGGYYPSRDGGWYAYHFFTYAALAAPVRTLLGTRPDAFRAHQYTNLLLFSFALLSLLQLARRPRLFWSLAPLVFFTPVLWFTPFASTEAFVFSLGVISLTCWLADRPILAILFNSIAATQYQPFALLSLFLFGCWFWRERGTHRSRPLRLAGAIASVGLVFVPSIFYYGLYGTPNMIASTGFAAIRFMAFDKLFWQFLDPNGGMIAFVPGVFLLLLLAAGSAIARAYRQRDAFGLELLGCLVLVMFASTVQRNWNHPTWGISRYVLYAIAPALLVIGVELRQRRLDARVLGGLVVVALALQLTVHRAYGFFTYSGKQADQHTAFAVWVLERWPALYSPPAEIFCERTVLKCSPPDPWTGLPLPEYLPAIWRDASGRARKILASRCDENKVLGAAPWSERERATIEQAFERCSGTGVFYIAL